MKNKLINQVKNETNCNGYSYIAHVAAIGNHNMVLKEIAEDQTKAYQAIYGYATSANIKSMQELMDICSNKTKCIKMAIRGLVRGNHMKALYTIKNYNNYKADIVFGYAQQGKEDMVAMLVNREPSLFENAVQGYASAGHVAPLLELINGTEFYGESIYQAAKAGHVELVNNILAEVGFNDELSIVSEKEKIRILGFLNKAISGYCKGFHLEEAGCLLKKGGNIQIALDALKVEGKPSLEAYIALYLVTSGEKSQALLEQMKVEFSIEDISLSPDQVDNIEKLHDEFIGSNSNMFEFISGLSSKGENILEDLDEYYNQKQF